jgi:hypothetical protein
MLYRFLYLFKELRELEADFQAKATDLNSEASLSMLEVPAKEVSS